jgi:hypothetical protein
MSYLRQICTKSKKVIISEMDGSPLQVIVYECRSSLEIPVLVRLVRGWNADVIAYSQEPHGQKVDAPFVVERG